MKRLLILLVVVISFLLVKASEVNLEKSADDFVDIELPKKLSSFLDKLVMQFKPIAVDLTPIVKTYRAGINEALLGSTTNRGAIDNLEDHVKGRLKPILTKLKHIESLNLISKINFNQMIDLVILVKVMEVLTNKLNKKVGQIELDLAKSK